MAKQQDIIAMFDKIAESYDITNRVMSCGIDRSWRKIACKQAFKNCLNTSVEIVDVACGTGDMISHWQSNAARERIAIQSIVGLDPSEGMLGVARKKMPSIPFVQCEATNLPLETASKDILSIAYGIRNVVERKKALSEFARVIKTDGILVILEFTKCENPSVMERLMGFYTKNILPLVGGILSRNYRAYRYLPDSIEEFLTTDKLKIELQEAGFQPLCIKAFCAGVCTLFVMRKVS